MDPENQIPEVGSLWYFISHLKENRRDKTLYKIISADNRNVVIQLPSGTHKEILKNFLIRFKPYKGNAYEDLISVRSAVIQMNACGLNQNLQSILTEMEV